MINIIKKENVDIVRTSFNYHINKNINKIQYDDEYKEKKLNKNDIKKFKNDILLNKKQAYLWILLVKSKYAKQIKFDINLGMMEDTVWLLQLLDKVKNIYFSNIITYNYILYQNSASNSISKAERNLLNVLYIKHIYDNLYSKNSIYLTNSSIGLLNVIIENIHKYCLSDNLYKKTQIFLTNFSTSKEYLSIVKQSNFKNLRFDRKVIIILLNKNYFKLLIYYCKIKEFIKKILK